MRVLLVEADVSQSILLVEQLVSNSVGEAVVANRLSAACRMLAEEPAFDVVLLELNLPDSEGMETIKVARAAAGATPIIVLTTRDAEEIADSAIECGAQDYLVKGCNGRSLSRCLRYAVERQKWVRRDQEQAALELKLQETTAEIRRRDNFLATLSHELRNPLAAISNAASLLKKDDANLSLLDQAADVITRQCEHVGRLLVDLLDTARVSQGKIRLFRKSTHVAQVVADAIETVTPAITECRHTLNVSLPETPLEVHGDAVRLHQILTNLLTNATKYTPSEGRIDVIVKREAAPTGDMAVVVVRDNGVGMAPAILEQIFEPFAQSPRTLARSEGGLGIGLAIVHNLVTMHGWQIQASSNGPGCGSQFVVRMPICESPANEPVLPPPARPKSELNILLVDDNIDANTMLQMLLVSEGHVVNTAADGLEGLDAIARLRPDVVLLDIGLPEVDGYEIAKRIRNDCSICDVYLVAMTGYARHSDEQRAMRCGFDAFLPKPVDIDKMQTILAAGNPRQRIG